MWCCNFRLQETTVCEACIQLEVTSLTLRAWLGHILICGVIVPYHPYQLSCSCPCTRVTSPEKPFGRWQRTCHPGRFIWLCIKENVHWESRHTHPEQSRVRMQPKPVVPRRCSGAGTVPLTPGQLCVTHTLSCSPQGAGTGDSSPSLSKLHVKVTIACKQYFGQIV